MDTPSKIYQEGLHGEASTTSADVTVPAPSSPETLARLFPTPRLPPSVLAPARLPGTGPEATAALLKNLKDNHERSHIFFNHFLFHNHAAHHLLALYALGAAGPVLDAAYEDTHLDHMRDAFVAPESVTITDENFTDYLGDDQYYNAWLKYFHRVVLEPGATTTSILEKYLFSDRYNIRYPQQGKQQPQMLNRFMEILLHPIIHVGYGAEFGLPGLIAEGLAWTACHPAGATTLVTRHLFELQRTTPVSDLERQEPKWMPESGSRLRALNILSLMRRDPRFPSKLTGKLEYGAMLRALGELINKYAEMWDCEIESEGDLERCLEEVAFVGALMYGVGSWDGDEAEYRADFFTAHVITSALFLPSICALVSRRSQTLLLRAHFLTSLTWWLARGRPGFPLKEFVASPLPPIPNNETSRHPNTFPGARRTPAACALPSSSSPYAAVPNPWYPILSNALVHPNEHLCKVQRALAHFNTLYGHREAGFAVEYLSKDGVDVDPEFAYLDGTVFLRVAWLTGAALGWVGEGEENTGVWDYQEFEKAAVEEMEMAKRQGMAPI
ncbi:hypothetical protein HYDPIDRAFT_25852 [Hydnomerulius pinastri MD-312]|uniref:Uncharacterized protein n=1 Tax=Hydnomerulius pinastri MD-312 TaxID=994086 RepID=A0A0C9VY68_9AGAM|nr:hypothetical protein HYDPIDRAFT_34286 [Hydnomerulius pinastri MD-312]KIJ67396.1 hypothetical protein HYDPIDRAFT_25852 [Hydnomerulius pinastri MD-312]